jgi:hypothetical protein
MWITYNLYIRDKNKFLENELIWKKRLIKQSRYKKGKIGFKLTEFIMVLI